MFTRGCQCLTDDLISKQVLWIYLARGSLASHFCRRKQHNLNRIQQVRQLSDKSFNINDIIKANAKHKPGKGVGTVTKKQLNKTAPKTKTASDEENNKNNATKSKKNEDVEKKDVKTKTVSNIKKGKDSVKSKDGTETKESILKSVPAHLKTILDVPLVAGSDLDNDNFTEFKEFVEELDLKYLPSISTIISETQSPEQVKALERWQARMTKELGGEEQFKQYKKDILDNGLNLHECIYNQLSGHPDATPLKEGNQGHWDSIAKVLPDVNEVVLMEKECLHPELFYRGKFDCIARYRGTLCLIEWKTSFKPKPLLSDTYDNPLQVAAYLGALNRSRTLKKHGIDELTSGTIVIAYKDGDPATVHTMNQKQCERYWKLWVRRLYTYWVAHYDKKKMAVDKFG